jgi:hypothetical protein
MGKIIKKNNLDEDQEESELYNFTTEHTTQLFQSDSEDSLNTIHSPTDPVESIDYDSYARVFDHVDNKEELKVLPVENNTLSAYAEFRRNYNLANKLHK